MFLFKTYIKVYLKKFIYKKKMLVFIVKEYYKYKFCYLNNLLNNFIITLYKSKRIIQLFFYNKVMELPILLFNRL